MVDRPRFLLESNADISSRKDRVPRPEVIISRFEKEFMPAIGVLLPRTIGVPRLEADQIPPAYEGLERSKFADLVGLELLCRAFDTVPKGNYAEDGVGEAHVMQDKLIISLACPPGEHAEIYYDKYSDDRESVEVVTHGSGKNGFHSESLKLDFEKDGYTMEAKYWGTATRETIFTGEFVDDGKAQVMRASVSVQVKDIPAQR